MLPKDVQAEEPNIGHNPQIVGQDPVQQFIEYNRLRMNEKINLRTSPAPEGLSLCFGLGALPTPTFSAPHRP